MPWWKYTLIFMLLLPRLLFISDVMMHHCHHGHHHGRRRYALAAVPEHKIPWNEFDEQFKHRSVQHLPAVVEQEQTQLPEPPTHDELPPISTSTPKLQPIPQLLPLRI